MQPAGPDPDPSSPAPPAPLPPPLPVPAQPVPLAYAGHATVPDRPARLRVLAVTSIVFASLSILTNLFGVGFYTFLIIAEQPGSPRAAALAAPAPARPYTGDPVGPEGMPKARRDEIVEALRTRQRLPGDHAEMLRRLLAEAGTRVFPDGTDPTSSVSHVSPDPGRSAESRLSFTTPTGRVELTSTTATFTPRQSARNRAAAGARRGAANGDNRAVKVLHNVVLDGSETQPRWSAIALGEMLDRLHQQSNGRLTALQAAVLKAEAESSDAPPLPRSWDERPDARVGSFPQDGVILYDSRELAPGRVWLLPDGRRVRQADAPHGVDPATGAARERPSPTPKPEYRYFPGSRASFALLAVDALLEVGLSIYLFAAAAVLFGSAEDGAQRHARYLLVKFPLILFSALASTAWAASLSEYRSLPPIVRPSVLTFLLGLVLVLIYPVAVLLVLRSRLTLDFFRSRGFDPWCDLHALRSRLRLGAEDPAARRWQRRGRVALVGLALAHFASALMYISEDAVAVGTLHIVGVCVAGLLAIRLFVRPNSAGVSAAAARTTSVILFAITALASPAAAVLDAPPTTHPATVPADIPALLERARDPRQKEHLALDAVRRLAMAGADGQAALLRVIAEQPDEPRRRRVYYVIGEVWSSSKQRWADEHREGALALVPDLLRLLSEEPHPLYFALIDALGAAPQLQEQLEPLLVGKNPGLRKPVAQFILRGNPRPLELIDRLAAGARERPVFDGSVAALVALWPASEDALISLLGGGNTTLQRSVLYALKTERLLEAPSVRQYVYAHLDGTDAERQRAVVEVLTGDRAGMRLMIDRATQGPKPPSPAMLEQFRQLRGAPMVLQHLERLARDERLPEEQRRGAWRAARPVLHALNDDPAEASPALRELLDDPDPDVQTLAALALPSVGSGHAAPGPRAEALVARAMGPGGGGSPATGLPPAVNWAAAVPPPSSADLAREQRLWRALFDWWSAALWVLTLVVPAGVVGTTFYYGSRRARFSGAA